MPRLRHLTHTLGCLCGLSGHLAHALCRLRCLTRHLTHALRCLRRIMTCAGNLLPGLLRLISGPIQTTGSLLPSPITRRTKCCQRLLRCAGASLQLSQVECGFYGDFQV